MQVVFERSQDEAGHIRTFFFRPEKPIQYTAGQFVELRLDHAHPDNRGTKRWFTLSSSPSEALVSITTKFAGKDSSSFKKALWKLKPGDQLHMSDPMGDFVLPKFIQTPLVFVAAGIGITPFHSILEWLAATNEERPIKLIQGVKREEDIIFQDTFERANIHATVVVEEPTDAWGGERGQLSAELILGLEQPSEDTLVYVSGPEPFVEDLKASLVRAGLAQRQIVVDAFPNYTAL